MSKYRSFNITIPKRLLKIIDELIKEGDYQNRSDFFREASRAHLQTWYPKKMNPEG